ncbi:MAG: SAM-dependent methyltransferase [Rhizobiales bacterium]|nr:SAM-dependent methyltransferase [Hyphomicrobiales bacterium]
MNTIINDVDDYYSGIARRYGPTPRGVDWTSAATQYYRFVQLLKLCDFDAPFSLNDFGCGYGALLEFLALRYPNAGVAYRGIDASKIMIETACKRWVTRPQTMFEHNSRCTTTADYSIASGVCNVRLGHSLTAWESYVTSILANLHATSRRGFAVNFMLPCNGQLMEKELYRTGPDRWIAYCTELGCAVEIVGDYGMREFTLLMRIPPSAPAALQ